MINRCRKGCPDGKEAIAGEKAWVVDKTSNAWLKVLFFWRSRVTTSSSIWTKDSYRYAVVGHPTRTTSGSSHETPYLG